MNIVLATRSLDLFSPSLTLMRVPQRGRWSKTRCPCPKSMIGARASSELVDPLTLSSDPDLTWQSTAGFIAGVTPFVIAGVEFSKRIIKQKKCVVCGGSGLVKRVGILVRCNACGGFLPWQSWSRFFSSGR